MRIAFYPMTGVQWTAGSIYLRNLLYALTCVCDDPVEPYVLAFHRGPDPPPCQPQPALAQPLRYGLPDRWSFAWAVHGAFRRFLSRDLSVSRLLRAHNINLLFGPNLTLAYPYIATLSWLPDFQHIHLPEMFTAEERRSRNEIFLRSARFATRVILLSSSVAKDFDAFAPECAWKSRPLQPVSYIPSSVYTHDPKEILKLYHLPERFVYLPNQFWRHKNHELAFRAIRIAKERGINICMVCSGASQDYRHPGFFSDLWQEVSRWDLRDQIIYLGLIPHEHVLLLMRQSICVLNPSRFEGWGITADEARSLGKPVLLSDIPAHREQNPPGAVFFDSSDSEELAAALITMWCNTPAGPDVQLETEAREELPLRLRAFGESFMSIAREALEDIRR